MSTTVTVEQPITAPQENKPKIDGADFADRVPSRQFRKSRTFISSRKESKRSKERKDKEPVPFEPNFANKSISKGSFTSKADDKKRLKPGTSDT